MTSGTIVWWIFIPEVVDLILDLKRLLKIHFAKHLNFFRTKLSVANQDEGSNCKNDFFEEWLKTIEYKSNKIAKKDVLRISNEKKIINPAIVINIFFSCPLMQIYAFRLSQIVPTWCAYQLNSGHIIFFINACITNNRRNSFWKKIYKSGESFKNENVVRKHLLSVSYVFLIRNM